LEPVREKRDALREVAGDLERASSARELALEEADAFSVAVTLG